MPSLYLINLDRYYGLVRYQAKKVYQKVHKLLLQAGKKEIKIELEDLVQEGFRGLLEARNRYNPNIGVEFATFALPRIDGAIKDYFRSRDHLTQREREKVKELDRTKEELTQSLGREPSAGELAQALGISEEEVRERAALRVIILSLADLTQSDEETEEQTLWEIPSTYPDPEEMLIIDFTEKEMIKLRNDVNNCLKEALSDQEKKVLILRVLDEIILQDVGRILNISKDTVKRREMKAKGNIRHCLENKGWEVADIIGILTLN